MRRDVIHVTCPVSRVSRRPVWGLPGTLKPWGPSSANSVGRTSSTATDTTRISVPPVTPGPKRRVPARPVRTALAALMLRAVATIQIGTTASTNRSSPLPV
jgi:hypothetical protein